MFQILRLFTLLTFIFAFVTCAFGFEGRIVQQMTDPPNGLFTITYTVKGSLTRIEASGTDASFEKFSILLSSQFFNITVLDTKQKTMKIWMEKPLREAPTTIPLPAAVATVEMQKTSDSEEILGIHCQKYIFQDKEWDVQVWATPNLVAFTDLGPPAALIGSPRTNKTRLPTKLNPKWMNYLRVNNLFPLKMDILARASKHKVLVTTNSVQSMNIDDSTFAPSTQDTNRK